MNCLKLIIAGVLFLAGCSSSPVSEEPKAGVPTLGSEDKVATYEDGKLALQGALKQRLVYWYGKQINQSDSVSGEDAEIKRLEDEAVKKWLDKGSFSKSDLDEILNCQDEANLNRILNIFGKARKE
ncbi:hypothetical protein HY605_00250 [Candidatus Peregrinibacteria bacterium]|nr:hypothetical protein [Candidatus Peregrinibacteria bacterium]